ncbi:DUF6126 family protein [Streptomyces sp. NBC_01351]|uniref:DUF6126 family protein n=1 Tax=Streptomyces sp. NBC_01351 TaxID=2903833 RepID=UPI002E36E3C5|nr:DUF6126 family protein [Streptomyces sp. NBC_01351]
MSDATTAAPNPDGESGSDSRSDSGVKAEARWLERGVALRAFFYIFGTHAFAGFVYLLFYLGEHAKK